jgi:hypothetical protein
MAVAFEIVFHVLPASVDTCRVDKLNPVTGEPSSPSRKLREGALDVPAITRFAPVLATVEGATIVKMLPAASWVTGNSLVTSGLPAVVLAVTVVVRFERPVCADPPTESVVVPALPEVGDKLHHAAFAIIF